MQKSVKEFGIIAVLMGGCSSERAISIKSGTAVFEALQEQGCHVVALDLQTEQEDGILDLLKHNNIDLVFIALHGSFGEDGQLQAILERNGISFTGSGSLASQRAMNKVATQEYLSQQGIFTPPYKVLCRDESIELKDILDVVGLPLVVKPASEGSSIGISIVGNLEELKPAIDAAFCYGTHVLLEKYINGTEITASILGQEALELVEIRPHETFFNFEAKYEKGLTDYIVPAQISTDNASQIQSCALKAFQLLGCRDFARADFILDDDGKAYFLEMNTIPGFTSTSLLPKAAKVAGYKFPDLCLRIIEAAHERRIQGVSSPRNY